MMRFALFVVGAVALSPAGGLPALGQHGGPPVDTLFEVSQQTSFGQSVFLLGDAPELGGGDLTRAIKLDPSSYPTWRVTVSLPEGLEYSYRYYVREDGPGRTSDAGNGAAVSGVLTGVVAGELETDRVVTTRLAGEGATLYWRPAGGVEYQRVEMTALETFEDGQTLFVAWGDWGRGGPGDGGPIEFFAEVSAGAVLPLEREPPFAGTHLSELPGVHAQLGGLFAYEPGAVVSPARRDYNPASPPSIFSSEIGEPRRYRVYLPRGYDEQTERDYPLVIFHDGQNVFEAGGFGSWNADEVIDDLTRRGVVAEAVYVGVDHMDRFRDYIPGPGADAYICFLTDELIPRLASEYRVRTDAGSVAAIGSSLGGVISMEMGWNHAEDFGLVGAMSGAWQVTTGTLNQQLAGGGSPDVRIYMDSGDAGTANDNYWRTFGLRDALVGGAEARYSLEGSLRHVVGFGDVHNEAAWERRLPEALSFLLPASPGNRGGLLTETFNAGFDADGDGRFDTEDLYAWAKSPTDLNGDGMVDGFDRLVLERAARRGERPGGRSGGRSE